MTVHFLPFVSGSSPHYVRHSAEQSDLNFPFTSTAADRSDTSDTSVSTSVLPLFAMKRILSLLLLLFAVTLRAQEPGSDGKIMLTVFLRHDQTMTLDEIDDHLEKTGFRKNFPPEGVEIVSYNIVMGVGHIITLRLPPDKLREVNLAFEHGVWGAFRTEFYPTYDYLKVFYDLKQKDDRIRRHQSRRKRIGNRKETSRFGNAFTRPKRPHRKSNQ